MPAQTREGECCAWYLKREGRACTTALTSSMLEPARFVGSGCGESLVCGCHYEWIREKRGICGCAYMRGRGRKNEQGRWRECKCPRWYPQAPGAKIARSASSWQVWRSIVAWGWLCGWFRWPVALGVHDLAVSWCTIVGRKPRGCNSCPFLSSLR